MRCKVKILWDVRPIRTGGAKAGFVSNARKCLLAVSSSFNVGSLPRSINSLDMAVDVPKSNCKGDVPVVRDGVFLHPRSRKGSACVPLYVVVRILKEVFKVLWKRSSMPLVWGWYAMDLRCFIPNLEVSLSKIWVSNA